MSSEAVSEQDLVIALMAEQGISRVQATKLLYEQSKLKKKEGNKVEINIVQGENSVVKNQIDRFNSQRDLSNTIAPVHHDIDMSQDGRPVLKLDTEASFRYISTGPHISPLANVPEKDEPIANEDPTLQSSQNVKRFPLRAKVNLDSGTDDDEVVAPYEEDKFNNSPTAISHKSTARVEARTVAGPISGFDDGGWNGELEEGDDDVFNAATASRPSTTPRRRSSNASLNSLRPLSRLHPDKFRDSMSTDPCDLDDEDYSSDSEADPARSNAHPSQYQKSRRKDSVRERAEGREGSLLLEKLQGEDLVTQSSHSQHTTSESRHHSSQIEISHSLSFSPSTTPTNFTRENTRISSNTALTVDVNKAPPPTFMTNEQRQKQFSHGAAGSWSSGTQSSVTESSENKALLAQQSAMNVQQLALEEKVALLNAGKSPRHSASVTTAPKLTPPAAQQGGASAMNVKVGTKKLTIRGAQQVSSQEDMPPPGYDDDVKEIHPEPPPYFNEQRSLPAPPPAYDESMLNDMAHIPAEQPLPDFLPDSDAEDEDGMTQEQRTAALMAKYKRRSYMKPNSTPEAFRDLEPVDPAVAREALLRREQELKLAGTWVPPVASIQDTTTPSSNAVVSTASNNVNTTESLTGGTIVSSSEEEYAHIVPTQTAVDAVMRKESNDLIEELVQQGYSRENAISLAKEIELDRRAGRFFNNQPGGNFSPVARDHSSFAMNTSMYNTTSNNMSWQEAAAAANNAVQYTSYKSAYAHDDDIGSVISNISAASRQSHFGETDRLLMNLLLTQQKTRYGVNMYESLENADEPLIERYMNKGMSLDQAVLKVFERKFGPVESQQLPRQVLPGSGTAGGSVSGSSIAPDSDEAHEIVAAMHAEIELLMLSGNYTREVAVRMLLNKVAKERAVKQSKAGNNLSLDIDTDPLPHHQSSKSLHRASSMSAMGSPSGRGGHGSYGENSSYGASGYHEGLSERGERRLHSTRSMYDSHSSRNGGGSVISERSSRSGQNISTHHPSDYHLHDDYNAQYHEQEYVRRDRSRSGDKYIIHHHYAPPSPAVNSSTVHASNGSVASSSGHGSKRRPSASNNSVMSGSGRGMEDSTYIPTLLAEQEAKYGVNMYEYLAPDDPEVNRLMRDFNFTRTDAMIAVFQQFPPQVASPTPTYLNSAVSIKSTSSSSPKGIAAHSPMKPYMNTSNNNNSTNSNIHSNGSYSGAHSSTSASNRPPAPSSSANVINSSSYDEDAELERVMKLSMQEINNKPGAVSMPGTNSSGAGNSSHRDVDTLVGMGFTSAQAQAALTRFNFDVHKAADYLLGSM